MRENSCSRLQAETMSKFAGIKLRPNQVDDYVYVRESLDKDFGGESDQILLDLVLDPNQTIVFREKFDNIHF